ncbi:MAG: ATP-binding cassette domain-containing protein [Actinomycetota bacterium]|nr:ATP-binding cassette domain-containing protein [Actinomycetota bacterium]
MAVIDVADVHYAIPGGRVLFDGVSFRVGDGQHVSLVGANGAGKTTLLRLIGGRLPRQGGHIHIDGSLGLMQQFVAAAPEAATIHSFLMGYAAPSIQAAAREMVHAEQRAHGTGEQKAQLRYATALGRWGEAGGYDVEVLWDTCTMAALGERFDDVAHRPVRTLSGGEQKRLALEVLFRSEFDILLLDEPDNFLDIPAKRWLEELMQESRKTILYVSHDRTLLAKTSTRVVTLEGHGAWMHEDSFDSYVEARGRRVDRIAEENRRYHQERDRLYASMKELKRRAAISDANAKRAKAAVTKLRHFEEASVLRERPAEQNVQMDLRGGRTGRIVLRTEDLAFPGIVAPFTTEIWFGERIGVVGPNGSGKSHFLRLLAGEEIGHQGEWKLGARVEPSLFHQTHERPELADKALRDVITSQGFDLSTAMSRLKRYELQPEAMNLFSLLSGGQQARFQILLMELQSPTMLLLDEPTDNLDIDSAEALEAALDRYEGTVLAVTHDRWFMQQLDRFLVFESDGQVHEAIVSPYT